MYRDNWFNFIEILFESQEDILNWEKRFFLREKCIALIILSVVDNAINICKNKKIKYIYSRFAFKV